MLPARLRATLTDVIKVVNYVKGSAEHQIVSAVVHSLRSNTPRSTVLHSGTLVVEGKYVRSGAGAEI